MKMNLSEIRQEILDCWEELTESDYPDDLLNERADSALPIYYSDIISDWQEMPSEFVDSWQEHGEANGGITYLMTLDLFAYYQDTYARIFQEIKNEKETETL